MFLTLIKIFVTLFLSIFSPFLLILVSPIFLIRYVLSKSVKYWSSDLDKILTPQATNLGVDDMQDHPLWTIVLTLVVNGKSDFEDFKQRFLNRVILAKCTNGDFVKPELQQYVNPRLGFLFWKWDNKFSIENHVRNSTVNLPNDVLNEDTTHHIANSLIYNPFPSKRSPWEIIFLKNYQHGEGNTDTEKKCVIFFRVHHVLAGKLVEIHWVLLYSIVIAYFVNLLRQILFECVNAL